MSSWSEENLYCPVCHEIYKDPVLLSCSHSFCKACWQRWWKEKATFSKKCPVCKKKSSLYDPPRNLALKNLCEAERDLRGSEALCNLHGEKLKLFCLDDLQPVCFVCSHSNSHTNHSYRPVNEAAVDYKEELLESLKPLQEDLELLNNVKEKFEQAARETEIQAQDTERQIKDVFLMFHKFLQKEEEVRIAALREEEEEKSHMMKRKIAAASREIADLSHTIRATEEVLRAEDLFFLQNYKTAAGRVEFSQPEVPKPIAGPLIDMAKHLNNLSFAVLGSMKEMISTSEVLDPKTNPEPLQHYTLLSEAVSQRPYSLALPVMSTDGLGMENGPGLYDLDWPIKPPRLHPRPATVRSPPPALPPRPRRLHSSDGSAAGTHVSGDSDFDSVSNGTTERMRESGVRRDSILQLNQLVISELETKLNRNRSNS